MKMEEWIQLTKLKKSEIETANLDIKVQKQNNTFRIYSDGKKLYHFQRKDLNFQSKAISVSLKSNKSLTVFQAGMLYLIFSIGKLPYDYANYHKCVAGKEFIENLEIISIEP